MAGSLVVRPETTSLRGARLASRSAHVTSAPLDTETSPEELETEFGSEVRRLVAEVSDDKSLEKAERKRLQIVHAASASDAAKQIKLADKICNVRDVTRDPPAEWSLERRREYLDWAVAVIDGCRGVNAALDGHFDELVAEGRATLDREG